MEQRGALDPRHLTPTCGEALKPNRAQSIDPKVLKLYTLQLKSLNEPATPMITITFFLASTTTVGTVALAIVVINIRIAAIVVIPCREFSV